MNALMLCVVCIPVWRQATHAIRDSSTPEAALRSFLAAYSAADYRGAAACVVGVDAGRLRGADFDIAASANHGRLLVSGLRVTVHDRTASASYSLTVGTAGAHPRQHSFADQTTELVRRGTAWLIVPIARRDAYTRVQKQNYVGSLALIVAHPDEVRGAMSDASSEAMQINICLTRMRHVCAAVLKYAAANNGRYNLAPDRFVEALSPYVKSRADFRCPADTEGDLSYALNGLLSKATVSRSTIPATTVLVYEGRNGKPAFRHAGKACVGLADGRVKMVTPVEAKALHWKPD